MLWPFEEKKFCLVMLPFWMELLEAAGCMHSYTKTWIMTDFFVFKKITTGGNLKWPIKFIYLFAASLLKYDITESGVIHRNPIALNWWKKWVHERN